MNPISQILANRQRIRYNRVLSDGFQHLFLDDQRKPKRAAGDVLAHLRNFCYADATTVKADPIASAVAQGRREVWLEIQYYLNLTDADLTELDWKFKRELEQLMQRSLDS